ncbi:MAG: GTPase [Acidobacteriota bacterium]
MPANLTPQYFDAEDRFKGAATDAERVEALQEMLRVIPKHKGTEKMQAELKRKLAKLRKEAQKKGGAASHKPYHHVDKEGAGQVVLCGPPNSGKSQLLANLTHAEPEVADYPFTTRTPQPGMMPFQDIQIQLVDTIPLSPEMIEPWQMALIHNADAVLLLFDVTDPELLDQTDFVLQAFQRRGLEISAAASPPVLVLGNKIDRPGAEDEFEVWQELFRESFQAESFSALSQGDLPALQRRLYEMLKIVRVYTKAPGHKRDEGASPFLLKKGSTMLDLAAAVHKDMAANFKFAKVWNEHGLEGLMVERSYEVQDGDLAEIHA